MKIAGFPFLFCMVLAMNFPFHASAGENFRTYTFKMVPAETAVVHISEDWDKISQCTSPCTLKVKGDGDPLFAFDLGYDIMITRGSAAKEIEGKLTFANIFPTKEEYLEKRRAAIQEKPPRRAHCDPLNDPSKDDQNAIPCERIPPMLPPRFIDSKWSGSCNVIFDINDSGQVLNGKIVKCTDRRLRKSSLISIKHWQYFPARRAGKAVAMIGVESKIIYNVYDDDYKLRPFPE